MSDVRDVTTLFATTDCHDIHRNAPDNLQTALYKVTNTSVFNISTQHIIANNFVCYYVLPGGRFATNSLFQFQIPSFVFWGSFWQRGSLGADHWISVGLCFFSLFSRTKFASPHMLKTMSTCGKELFVSFWKYTKLHKHSRPAYPMVRSIDVECC